MDKIKNLQESSDVKQYIVVVKHDKGTKKIRTSASSEQEAKEKIMKAENCPANAIVSVSDVVVKETTTASSSGQYSQPAIWAKDPKNAKYAKDPNASIKGGTVIKVNPNTHDKGVNSFKKVSESYLTNPLMFQQMAEKLGDNILDEERKHPSMINLEKVTKDNPKNFIDDLKANDELIAKGVKEAEKEAKEVDSFSEDDEKNFVKIEPKYDKDSGSVDGRKAGFEEDDEKKKEIMLNRGRGIEDNDFDIEPTDKYKENLKRDMGEEKYKDMEEKKKFREKMPMYNKDAQPIKNVKESISGYYLDSLGKKKFIEVDLDGASLVTSIDESYTKIETTGMGNKYTSTSINESLNKFSYYIKDNVIFKLTNTITESVNKKNDENYDKLKHLMGYKPSQFVKKNKK